jgi:hypothetical protein
MPKEKKSMIIAAVAAVVVLALLYIVFVRPMMMSGDARVLLVASDVLAQAGGKTKLESYLSSGTTVVPYNYDRVATYAELGDLIKGHLDATGASRVRSVGIMYHTPNRYNLKCFASDPEKSTVSGSLESFEPFRRFVVALRGAYGVEDVDLVSCDVVSAETSVLSALDFNGARVNASTNTTGQVKQGPVGDWVLEAGNVNLIGRYFNASITMVDIALSWTWAGQNINVDMRPAPPETSDQNFGAQAQTLTESQISYFNREAQKIADAKRFAQNQAAGPRYTPGAGPVSAPRPPGHAPAKGAAHTRGRIGRP